MKTLRIILYVFVTGCLLFTFVNGVIMRMTL